MTLWSDLGWRTLGKWAMLHPVKKKTVKYVMVVQFLSWKYIKITNLKALKFLYYFGPNQHNGDQIAENIED